MHQKTVGIITTYWQPNWGSVLQAYALQQTIISMGYSCEVINYKYPNEFHYSHGIPHPRSWLRNMPGNCWLWLKKKISGLPEHKMKLLDRFIVENMQTTKVYRSHEELHGNPPVYDIYVAGSDQIWNPNTMVGDMSYMLDFAAEGTLRISYSSSFACERIPDNLRERYVKYLNRMDAISVREENGAKMVESLIQKEVQVVADPTLLLDCKHWQEIARKAKPVNLPEKYILCYMLGYTYNPEASMTALLQRLQAQYGIPVVALNRIPDSFTGDVFQLPTDYGIGIEEFLYLMENATVVATSSFHGTAFSANLGRPFIALADGTSTFDDRIPSLLSQLGLENHVVYSNAAIPEELRAEYDVDKEQEKLSALRNQSLDYLKSALRKDA